MKEPMTIDDAISIATNWISESDLSFSSAFISGSVASAPRDAVYESTSDIDCYLVTDADPPDGKIGKITVNGALLDVSWIPWSALENAETDAVLASLLYFGLVVQDDGKLGKLQNKIKTDFITPETLTERVESIRDKIRNGLAVDSSHLSLPEQVMNWLFPATLVTHISLVVSCSPLTVRKRFLAAKAVRFLPRPRKFASMTDTIAA